ncbi:MAG: DUF721 domain-containing protein [Planctomycetota bacterium]|jgi:predicted nucleic acid-binding Zn ribbon protein|nr:DUF721 domain-containing protein [Planctomycetota bacterium]
MARKPPPAAIRKEESREWRDWFLEVHWRRQGLADAEGKAKRRSFPDPADGKRPIIRPAAEPEAIGKILSRPASRGAFDFSFSLEAVAACWRLAAGSETAEASRIHSLKKGVLTMAIGSAPLLQEIRQFRQAEILRVLRENWPLPQPLLRVVYRPGG